MFGVGPDLKTVGCILGLLSKRGKMYCWGLVLIGEEVGCILGSKLLKEVTFWGLVLTDKEVGCILN